MKVCDVHMKVYAKCWRYVYTTLPGNEDDYTAEEMKKIATRKIKEGDYEEDDNYNWNCENDDDFIIDDTDFFTTEGEII